VSYYIVLKSVLVSLEWGRQPFIVPEKVPWLQVSYFSCLKLENRRNAY
jgi:hypothetical protein